MTFTMPRNVKIRDDIPRPCKRSVSLYEAVYMVDSPVTIVTRNGEYAVLDTLKKARALMSQLRGSTLHYHASAI